MISHFNWIQTLQFLYPIIHLPKKLKNQLNKWCKIGLQLKFNIESNQIWTFQFYTQPMCNLVHMHEYIFEKIIITWFKLYFFFKKKFKLYMVLASLHIFKPLISKICNNFSYYIYIYRIQNLMDSDSSIFAPNNSIATKI